MQPHVLLRLLLLLLEHLLLRRRRERLLGALHRRVALRQLVALAADTERPLPSTEARRQNSRPLNTCHGWRSSVWE